MEAGNPTPVEMAELQSSALLEKLNGTPEFEFFKEKIHGFVMDAFDAFLSSNTEPDLWRAQGGANMAKTIVNLVEQAGFHLARLQANIRQRGEAQAADEMAALDLDAQRMLNHHRRTRRSPT